MEKYTTKKQNSLTKKQNVFKKYQVLKEEIFQAKKNIKILKKQKAGKSEYEIHMINYEIYQQRKRLTKLEKNYSKMKKSIVKIGATLGIALTIATTSYGTYLKNKDFDSNVVSTYDSIQSDDEKTYDANEMLYQQLKLDIEQYVELSKKEKLTEEEKKHINNLKNRINSNPEAITMLSLDILKQKIAKSIDLEDYSKIKIEDNSTQIRADKYHPESGSKIDIVIYADGKEIASHRSFKSLSTGETTDINDDIPEKVKKTIRKIVKAQSNAQDTKKATKALKSSLELEEKDISFENSNIKKDEER